MDNKNNEKGFSYTYSAAEQEELRRIREKYSARPAEKEDKLERLRSLDARATKRARIVSITVGTLGTLILGVGMSLIMSEFSHILGQYEPLKYYIGSAIGIVGGVLAGVTYPLYRFIIKRERAKVAPEILRLTDELMK